MPVTSYSRTPADNNSAPPDGWPEGMAPSAVNNSARQLMTDIVNEAAKGQARVLASVSGTNTITASMSPDLDAYAAGMIIVFTPANNNTGATTLNIDSLGALDIQKADGDALISGDLVAGIPAVMVLDSGADDWILLNPQASILGAALTAFARYADTTANFTGTLQYGGVEVGYKGMPSRSITGTDNTQTTDGGKVLIYSSTGGHTLTLDSDPANGDVVTIINNGSGDLTIAGSTSLSWFNGSGTISTGNRTLAVAGYVSARHSGSGAWIITGTGLS